MSDVVLLEIDPGTTFTVNVTVTDNLGAAIDITGYTWEWVIENCGLFVYTTTPEIVISAPTTGVIKLTLSPEETAHFQRIRGSHSLVGSSPDSPPVVTEFITGSVDARV